MNERLQQQRTSLDLQRLGDMVQALFSRLAPRVAEPKADTAIDWEDGEIEDQTEPPVRR